MRITGKRLTALLLALAMCLSLLSVNVWAAEEPEDGSVSAQSSEAEGTVPEAEEAAPQSEESEPEPEESEAEPEESALEPEETAPEAEAAAPEAEETEPEVEETELEAEESAPEPEAESEAEESTETAGELNPQTIVDSGTCGWEKENMTWTLDDTGTLTISGKGEIWEHPWTEKHKSDILHVVIQEGVTNIMGFSFYYCYRVTDIHISDSVTRIGMYAFSGCESLKKLTIPRGVREIWENAFAEFHPEHIEVDKNNPFFCTIDGILYTKDRTELVFYPGKTEIIDSYTVPDGVIRIWDHAFENVPLNAVHFPDSLMYIGEDAFGGTPWEASLQEQDGYVIANGFLLKYLGSSTEVTIPEGVTRIGDCVFDDPSGYRQLTSVTIPEGVTSIGNRAFSGQHSLTNLTLPNSLTSIGFCAFQFCDRLDLKIPKNVKRIGEYAFTDCALSSVTIPDGMAKIERCTFAGCRQLSSIAIPNSVTSIGRFAFSNTNVTTMTIPDSVTTLDDAALYCCERLDSLTLGKGISRITSSFFECCINLHTLTLPDNITAIDEDAFCNCPNLTTLVIGKNVTHIGEHALGYGADPLETNMEEEVSPMDAESNSDLSVQSEEEGELRPMAASSRKRNYWRMDGLTIVGYAGTEAERYSKANNIPFKQIGAGKQDGKTPLDSNSITASNVIRSYSAKSQTFKLKAKALGGAKLSYKSGNKKVKVDKKGKVTLPAKFSGTVKITVTSAETAKYKPATKTVTVTVPTGTKLKKATGGKGQISLEWKKNKTGKKYEIQVSLKKDFKKTAKKVTIKKNTILKTTVKGLKKGSYFLRMRTVNGKAVSNWSGAKKVTVK